MELFYSNDLTTNKSRYRNEIFNENFEASLTEKDPQKRGFYFIKAQTEIIEDAVVIPLLVDNMLIMINARVKGLDANKMEILNFKKVFIKEPKQD